MSIFKLAKLLPMSKNTAYANAFADIAKNVDQEDPVSLYLANKAAKDRTTKYIASRNRNFKIGAGVLAATGLVAGAAHAYKKKKGDK